MSRWWRAYDEAVDDPKLQRLGPALGWAWFNLMCISSKHDGALPSIGDIAFKLRTTEQKAAATIAALVSAGLFDKREDGRYAPHNWNGRQYKGDVTDSTNAERQKRYRERHRNGVTNVTADVTTKRPETETETETKKTSEANASGADAPPDPSEPERQFFARGKERGALGPSSGGQLAKLLKTCGGNVALARSKLELAITKEKPGEFIAGILRAGFQAPTGKPLTQHQIERQTTRDILDELDSFDSRGGQADPGLLRHDSGGRPAGIHGGVRRDVVQISASSRRAGD